MDYSMMVLVFLCGIMVLLVTSMVNAQLKSRKYPYLCDRFLRTLSYSKENRVLKISDKLELHLENDLFLYLKVMVKNEEGHFVEAESEVLLRPKTEPIRFGQPWHDDIANHLKNLYETKKQNEQQAELKKRLEIETIKSNWN